jgi:hypothetical protein
LAVRIEFFTIAGTGDFELVPPAALDAAVAGFDAGAPAGADPGPGAGPDEATGDVRCVGWLSASDDDEARFTDWCEEVDDDLGIGLLQQGVGESDGLTPLGSEATAVGEWEAAWSTTLHDALAAAAGGRIGWRTNFDVAGTTGTPDDYPTAAHPAG